MMEDTYYILDLFPFRVGVHETARMTNTAIPAIQNCNKVLFHMSLSHSHLLQNKFEQKSTSSEPIINWKQK